MHKSGKSKSTPGYYDDMKVKPKMPHEYIPGAPRPGQHLGKHPGFKAVQQMMASKQHMPMANAGAILATSSRQASPAAKRRNPRLNRVK